MEEYKQGNSEKKFTYMTPLKSISNHNNQNGIQFDLISYRITQTSMNVEQRITTEEVKITPKG